MSRIIGVLNYKGGTGKTTTVVNLAVGLALRGARVLGVDMDAQGSLAAHLGVESAHSLAHLLLGQAEAQSCIVPARQNLDLITSDRNLLLAEGELWRMGDDEAAWQLMADRLKGINNGYDYVFLDYSPSISRLGESGLFYADEIIVPVSMDYLALIGVRQVIKTLKSIGRTFQRQVQLSWIVPTFYYGRLRKDNEIMEILQRHFPGKLAHPIRANVSLSEAPSHQMSIYEYAPRSPGAVDYARLVETIVNNG